MTDHTRRHLLFLALAACVLAVHPPAAMAKDGGSDDGGSDGGGNSGSGSGNSGSGGGDDDDDDEDDDDNGSGAAGGAGGGSGSGSGGEDKDHDRARDAVRRGDAVSLKALKRHLASNYPGKVLKIELRQRSNSLVYKVRMLEPNGRLKTLRLDARSLARKLF